MPFIEHAILHQTQVFDQGPALIQEIERINWWRPAATVSQDTEYRHNSTMSLQVLVAHFPELRQFEESIFNLYRAALQEYCRENQHFKVEKDEGYHILKYEVGDSYKEHVDYSPHSKLMDFRSASGVLYLNSEYEGGELEFPRQKLTIHPQAGDLLLFPANFAYPHIAHPVTKGRRYAVVTWFS
jgi:Rps23 Pro-64 3,4-dihydroxylase Tpa1-like proline 4-hydroxylase